MGWGGERDAGRESSHSQVVIIWTKRQRHIPAGWGQIQLTSDITGRWGKIQPKPRVMSLGLRRAENLESQHLGGEKRPWLQRMTLNGGPRERPLLLPLLGSAGSWRGVPARGVHHHGAYSPATHPFTKSRL